MKHQSSKQANFAILSERSKLGSFAFGDLRQQRWLHVVASCPRLQAFLPVELD